jgi:UDP-glucose 4-epimerase
MRAQSWPELLREPYDAIFHFAANAYVPPSVANPAWDYQINFESTFQLLEAMRAVQHPATLVYASSAAVYGNPLRIPVSETDATFPISPYGVGKLAAERYVAVYSGLYGIRAASLRLFSIYGPRQRKQVVYDLMERISQNRDELFIHGDGTQERDFGYVEDVARAAMIVAERGALGGEVYNVGSGQPVSIDWLATGRPGAAGGGHRPDQRARLRAAGSAGRRAAPHRRMVHARGPAPGECRDGGRLEDRWV